MAKVGVIGGSGLYQIEGIENVEDVAILDTPFGPPSDHFMTGTIDGVEVVFLARHGKGHYLSPSDVNYRANIFEMKRLGVDAILSVSAVGSLKEEIAPLHFVVPDQFVDRTNRMKESTFFSGGIVAHVSMADPVSSELTKILIESARDVGVTVHDKGTYINMEGPQFSTRAESNLYRSWNMDIIGMTNMAEAKLAREAEISYASICAVTDYDCWHDGHENVTVESIIATLNENVANSKEILKKAIPQVGVLTDFSASNALQHAIITNQDNIHKQKIAELDILLNKYIKK